MKSVIRTEFPNAPLICKGGIVLEIPKDNMCLRSLTSITRQNGFSHFFKNQENRPKSDSQLPKYYQKKKTEIYSLSSFRPSLRSGVKIKNKIITYGDPLNEN